MRDKFKGKLGRMAYLARAIQSFPKYQYQGLIKLLKFLSFFQISAVTRAAQPRPRRRAATGTSEMAAATPTTLQTTPGYSLEFITRKTDTNSAVRRCIPARL